MRYIFITLLINFTVLQLSSQENISFASPLNLPLYLSGNFGEIRSDHFHSGIDIKTNGSIGYPVFSIEDGYISRIKVQANGYGNSLYITHSNGYTSVYGHLNNFTDDVAEYVREIQYKRESHGVDIFPEKTAFQVRKGQLIAISGNSGGSTGPHLHFEVRKTAAQIPVNVLKFNFPVEDHTAPVFFKAFIYPMKAESRVNNQNSKVQYSLVKSNGNYTIQHGDIPKVYGEIGIGTEVFDYLNGANNRCGVYSLELYLDGLLIYKHRMDEVAFSETRYINAHIDYEEKVYSNIKSHKLFKLPNNSLKIYEHLENNGVLSIRDSGLHEITIIAKDVTGNQSTVNFSVRGVPANPLTVETPLENVTNMSCKVENRFADQGMELLIPKNALYEDLNFTYTRSPGFDGLFSDIFNIHNEGVPLHNPFLLSIASENLSEELKEKAIIVKIDDESNVFSAGGEFKNGNIESLIRSFGSYSVSVDTVAPEIIPLNGNSTNNYSEKSSVKFIIRDDLSGIKNYDGYIDNKWVLFEYDLKNDLISYTFDKKRLKKGTEHELELYISDAKGNVNLYHTTFIW